LLFSDISETGARVILPSSWCEPAAIGVSFADTMHSIVRYSTVRSFQLERKNPLFTLPPVGLAAMRRLATIWRLAMLFVRELGPHADGPPIGNVLRSIASGTRSAGAASLGQRVPVLQNLSGVLQLTSGLLSQHPGLSEAAVRVALAELRTLKAPLADAAYRAALEKALPAGRAAALVDLEPVPERCAIAEQTHRGRLEMAPGQLVPVRIRLIRTDTRAELGGDLDLLGSAARLAERFSRDARRENVAALVARVSQSIEGMFDMRQRAADQSYLGYRLRSVSDDRRVVVPDVFWDYCGDTVLVTRAIRGVPLGDAGALRANGLDPAALIATWIEVFFEIALGEGVFHAGLEAASATVSIEPDSHGRLVLDGDTPLTFFAAHEQSFLVTGSDALLRGDHKAATRAHLEHGRPPGREPHHAVRVEATYRREAERFAGTTHPHAALGDLFTALGKGPLEHAFTDAHAGIASRAALLARSAQGIEEMARRIAPDVDVWRIMRRVIMRLALDQFSGHGVMAQVVREAAHWPHALPRLPNLLADWIARQNPSGADSTR
jgi:ubiquinone biosynthesis protein